MQNDKIVVGLDIGTTKICALVGRLNEFGKLEILGTGRAISEGVKDGVVSNISKTVAGIEEAIRGAEEESGIDINVVNVGIAGRHIRSVQQSGSITRKNADDEIALDDVERLTADMYRTVTEPGTEIIHVLPQHYTVDYEQNIKDPIGMAGVKLEADFQIVTAQTNAIRNIRKCVERTGIEIDNIILEPLASSMAVLSEEEKEAGVALIDIGGGTTDMAIFHNGILRHTTVLPFGGNIITSDIKQGLAVMQNQAEQLKVRFGKSLSSEASEQEVISIPGLRNRPPKEISRKNLAYIIEARMEEIIDMVMGEIQASGYRNRLAGGIVLSGGGALLNNLQDLFEYKTGLDVRIGYPVEYLGKGKDDAIKNPMYATSIGLVLAGFRSIDERDVEHTKAAQKSTGSRSRPSASQNGDFFSSFLKKTRELLIDDFDDNTNY